jgi:stage II sporulation protein P
VNLLPVLFTYGGDAALHRTSGSRSRAAHKPLPAAVKGLAVIIIAFMTLRILSSVGADEASEKYVAGLVSDGHLAGRILNFELGLPRKTAEGASLADRLIFAALPSAALPDTEMQPAAGDSTAAENTAAAGNIAASVSEPVSVSPDTLASQMGEEPDDTDLGLFYDLSKENPPAATEIPTVIIKPAAETSADAIAVNNKAGYDVNTAALMKEPLNIALSGDSPAVLIIHTHGSEAYLPEETDSYEASDPFRTQQKNYSVIRVGDELAAAFAKRGIAFIHDRNIYDYPSYQGSYNRSYEAIQAYLAEYPSIMIVIDLHRDAIEAADGSVYKTIAQIGDSTCSQVMLVMGTDAAGLKHPGWRENFKLALHLQKEMNALYPSLAKPIELSQYRYNQQATKGSMILEVGCTGNTLQESIAAVQYFADAAANVILGLYK